MACFCRKPLRGRRRVRTRAAPSRKPQSVANVGAILLFAIQLLVPDASPAQTLDVPATVQAAANGAFSYQATFTAGPGGDAVYAYVVDDLDNTDADIFYADLFCVSPLAEGEQLFLELPHSPGVIAGSLVDPGLEGTIRVEVDTDCSCCPTPGSGLYLTATTTILASPPAVPTLSPWALGGLCVVFLTLTSAALSRTGGVRRAPERGERSEA